MRNDKKVFVGGGAFLAVVIATLVQTVIMAIVSNVAGSDSLAYQNWNYIIRWIVQASAVAAVFLLSKLTKTKPDNFFRKPAGISYVAAVIIALSAIAGFYLLSTLFVFGLEAIGYNFMEMSLNTPYDWIMAGISVLVFAPFCEEVLFRGSVPGSFTELTRDKKRGELWTVLLCGAAFMLMHTNPEQTVYQFLLGCMLAMLTIACRSVIPAIIVHFLNNAIALVLSIPAFAVVDKGIAAFFTSMPALYVITAIAAAAGAVIGIYFLCRFVRKKTDARGEIVTAADEKPIVDDQAKNSGTIMLAVACGVCLLLWIVNFVAAMSVVV